MNKLRMTVAALALCCATAAGYEGIRHVAYIPVPGDVPTICRGHTQGVHLGQTATDAECEAWFKQDLTVAFKVVAKYVTVDMPDARRAALADFVFNVGEGNFAHSTLLKKLNSGDTIGACNEFSKWVYSGGQKLQGLVRRRAAERELCLRT